jgi:membrane-associated phospholipid phosphatase
MSLLYIIIVVSAALFFIAVAVMMLSTRSAQVVEQASIALTQVDYAIFGVYSFFWLQQFPALAPVMIQAYRLLNTLLPLVFLFLLVFRQDLFRQFIMSAVMAVIISIPVWYAVPAISPDELWRQNILHTPIPPAIQTELERPLAPELAEYLGYWQDKWSRAENNYWAITSFPSMHAAWGVIIAYYGTLLWWPLGIVLIPWATLNGIATVYTIQHYAIDPIFGIVTACIAIIAVGSLMRLEKRYYTGKYPEFYVGKALQADIQFLLAYVLGRSGKFS